MAAFTPGQLVSDADLNPVTFDTGDVKWSARRTASTGWYGPCRGDALSRTTFANLFAAIVPLLGTFTVTIAAPGVFTLTAHGLVIGDRVYLTTTGALPTGLAANTIYYVVVVPDANSFQVSSTEGGGAITTTGSQSGTHSLRFCPYGNGDGSTTFNVPDGASRSLVGSAGATGHADHRAMGQNDGVTLANRRQKHRTTNNATLPNHVHTTPINTHYAGPVSITGFYPGTSDSLLTENATPTYQALNLSTSNPTTNPALGGSIGTNNANDVLDAPATLVLNLYIKT